MLANPIIFEKYSIIAEEEKEPGHYATHCFSHIKRVVENCEKIARMLGLCNEDIAGVKIAALLHDISLSDGGGRKGHAGRSAAWAKTFLQDKGLNYAIEQEIISAVGDHSNGDCGGAYAKILTFADKM
ncbi:MAG: HD domain-containing protein, partial [Defluviitaleaceae bacterium]|nr:HD domain-containing protein [Defluviitaleaceae bacterium]